MSGELAGKTMFISGGSRGIGLAIAVRAARAGANVALVAKTDEPHPQLPGTVHTAAADIRQAGGEALPIVGDIRDQEVVLDAVARTVDEFGGIDICVNNASAINLANVETMPLKRYDLIQSINSRGTFLVSQAAIPHLKQSGAGHIITLSPPINLNPRWLGAHAPYTLSKYGMTLLTLGMAAELDGTGVVANCLWPETTIATAAVQNLLGGDEMIRRSRTPEIVADAAFEILTKDPAPSGECFIDSEVLGEAGGYDLESYAVEAGQELYPDVFLD